MPEGPEIKQAADAVARAIVQKPLINISFAFERLQPYEDILAKEQIWAVQAKGKAMLIRFQNQLNIYSHNQLYGKWYIKKANAYPVTNRQLRLAIHTQKQAALLYSASDIDVITDEQIASHPFLSRLGPDVLDDATTVEQVQARFLEKRFYRRGLISLLLDQGFLCGLGNYLRSEVLFVAKVNPALRPIDCTAEQILALANGAIAVSRRSYVTKGITNDLAMVAQLKQQGYGRQQYRFYVFNRDGKPCYRCGTEIVKDIAGGRRIYYCPYCQKR
ncbi:endonuclease VIII [Stenomitos frigidus]|uniref:DNA-(apurinic or apyrimidinic site) lyase n=1 Tax=Stenomitos frigidus ULC18 TaxID=2107698 RepID=A0A2T1DWQ9_9CYAN|nr:endonuclease VIII [Stenomitos frigidus]PSB24902.1 endonuclease VIII [Stenomitos frigidus ULC18]